MVKTINFLLLILLTSQLNANNSNLDVVTADTHSQIGHPLQIKIIANNINKRMATINLDKLKKDFGVYVIESSNKSDLNKNEVQELKVYLYPQQVGKLKIPSLTLGKYSSATSTVTILPAAEDKNTVTFNSINSSVSVWQRQQIIITSTVLTQSKFASIHAEDFSHKGVESFTLESTRDVLKNGQFRLTTSWVLYPLIAGEYNFNFPSINYRLGGKVKRRFIPKAIKVSVKELPPYIPPLLPVGKIEVDKDIIKNDNFIGNEYVVAVKISSNHALATTLPNLPQDFMNDEGLIVGETLSRNTSSLKNKIFNNTIHHHIPISFTETGFYQVPAISYKYFEPDTGKIVTIKSPEQDLFIASSGLKILLLLSLGVASIITLVITNNYARLIYKQRRARNRIIKSILKAASPLELHFLLNEFSKTHKWSGNMTLKNWLTTWQREKGTSINDAIDALSEACYANRRKTYSQSELNIKIYQLLKS